MVKRILLLEARHENPEHHRGVEFYPFLAGFLRSIGADVQWWVAGVPRLRTRQGQGYDLDVEGGPWTEVFRQLASWRPDCIAANDVLSAGMRERIRSVSPGSEVLHVGSLVTFDSAASAVAEWFLGPGEVPRGLDPTLPMVGAATPSFERRFFDERLEKAPRQFHRLAVRFDCWYKRKAASNPFYRDIESETVQRFKGCTFCYLPLALANGPRASLTAEAEIDLVLSQIELHQRASPPEVSSFVYLIDQSRVGDNIHKVLARLVDRELKPLMLVAMLRIDSLLARRKTFEELLPKMDQRGYCLKLVSIGADNLSAEENDRFNKGVSPDQIIAYLDMIKELTARYPAAISAFHPSWILFTPWTRPADLRANFRAVDKLGPSWLRDIIGTVLQLWDGTAITELARHDGLLADRFGSIGNMAVSCVPAPGVREIPWRFQDPRVEKIHAILIRLEPKPQAALIKSDDPLLVEIQEARRRLPGKLSNDYARLVMAVVDAVEALGAGASVRDVFDWIGTSSADPAAVGTSFT